MDGLGMDITHAFVEDLTRSQRVRMVPLLSETAWNALETTPHCTHLTLIPRAMTLHSLAVARCAAAAPVRPCSFRGRGGRDRRLHGGGSHRGVSLRGAGRAAIGQHAPGCSADGKEMDFEGGSKAMNSS